jgi:hypothetical protein
MTRRERVARARKGGKARGWQERRDAIEKYNAQPHLCRQCKRPIPVGLRRVADVMKKKFCDSSCSAKFNNNLRPRELKLCKHCNKPLNECQGYCIFDKDSFIALG